MSFLFKSDAKIIVFCLLSLYIQQCVSVNYPNQFTQERTHLQLFNMFSKKDSSLDGYCSCKNLSIAWQLLSRCERLIKMCTSSLDVWVPAFNVQGSSDSELHINPLGKKELPFYVDEPYFKIIRKESRNQHFDNDDPFIPPRGKKRIYEPHNINLDYVFFAIECEKRNFLVAIRNGQDNGHRMKRDKLSEILKYDETFFPNRG